jgi:maltose/maltodextrin transport system permease protein
MTAPAISEGAPAPVARHRSIGIGRMAGWAALAVIALALLYVVWGLYIAGEPLFAAVALGLMVGIVLIYGARRFYAARFVFPAVAAILIFIVLPVLYTSYVGFENFVKVLGSEGIRQPMLQIFAWTVAFAALSMLLTFSLGILLASILQWPHLRGKSVYRILLILPYAVPAFISILVFRGLFNQNFGEINLILGSIFGLKPSWGTDPTLARATTLIVNTWLGYPYMMLIGMGYLQSIPADHYKAAALEGAGPLRSFFSITLPQILPPFVPLLISSFAFNFNNVVLILLLTRGLPDIPGTRIPAGQTDILGSFTYRVSFQDSGQNFGLAGAISTLIFVIVGVIAYANFVALRRAAEARGRG